MNKNANPIDYILNCCEQGLVPSTFDILNAKDELKRLREQANNFQLVAWTRINSKGDLYDPRFYHNPHVDQTTVLPLYSNKKEFQEKYGKLSK
jgi:hypothetical protein